MYIIVKHDIQDRESAFARGERLQLGEGAPSGTRVLQFYPSTDGTEVVCLWEGESVDAIQGFVDETLGDSSVNTSYEVAADPAFSERPLGLATQPLMLRAG